MTKQEKVQIEYRIPEKKFEIACKHFQAIDSHLGYSQEESRVLMERARAKAEYLGPLTKLEQKHYETRGWVRNNTCNENS